MFPSYSCTMTKVGLDTGIQEYQNGIAWKIWNGSASVSRERVLYFDLSGHTEISFTAWSDIAAKVYVYDQDYNVLTSFELTPNALTPKTVNIAAEIIKELTPQQGDIVVEGKMTLDAFHSTALNYLLRANEIEYVAVVGFHTDWCVESTARSAYDLGYRVIVIGDCTATDTQEEQDFCEKWIFPKIGTVTTAREFLEALE